MADIGARDEGSLWLVFGGTDTGDTWLEEHLQEDAMRWAGGFVVEPRCVGPILAGACEDGLEVAL